MKSERFAGFAKFIQGGGTPAADSELNSLGTKAVAQLAMSA
jgi:hypothetical protein